MKRQRRTTVLVVGLGVAATAAFGTGPASARADTTQDSLHDLAQQHGKYIGNAISNEEIDDSEYADMVSEEVGSLTVGNAMKWDATEPQPGEFEFDRADSIMEFAGQHDQQVRGHTLVWHSQTPDWVQNLDADELSSAMEDHIAEVVDRYQGDIASWDVVNEPMAEDGSLRDSFWLQTLGEDYIADAFRAARAADPDAKLYINDYNIDGISDKSDGMYELVSDLVDQGVPIDGVGIQGHLSVEYGFPEDMEQNIRRFTELGLEVTITELDVRMPTPPDEEKLATQADYYANVAEACLAVEDCVGITLWSLTDRHSWIPEHFPGEGAAHLTDEDLQPKPAYDAFRQALSADQ